MIDPLPTQRTPAEEPGLPRQTPTNRLPRWEHLPVEQKRELVMTLATLLSKQWSLRHLPQEVECE